MKSMDKFYDDYWKYRQKINKIHTKEGEWVPERIYKTLELIHFKDNLKILDIGCGEGTIGQHIQDKKYNIHIIGMDISKEALNLANTYYDQTILFNLDEDEFPEEMEEQFDYVICIEVLEHLFNPKRALLNIGKLVKDNGIVITSFPNMAWWVYRIDLLIKGRYPEENRLYDMVEHLQNFTLPSFTELVEETDFTIVKLNPTYNRLPKLLYYLPSFFKNPLLRKYPNVFGYQIVLSLKKSCL